MKFYCISDTESVLVFKLVNIQTFEAIGRKEAIDIFNNVTRLSDAGVILITDIVASLIRNEMMVFASKNSKPLILEIPSYTSSVKPSRKQNGTTE